MEQGILMATSLANFRSDYNLVHIPESRIREVLGRLMLPLP